MCGLGELLVPWVPVAEKLVLSVTYSEHKGTNFPVASVGMY